MVTPASIAASRIQPCSTVSARASSPRALTPVLDRPYSHHSVLKRCSVLHCCSVPRCCWRLRLSLRHSRCFRRHRVGRGRVGGGFFRLALRARRVRWQSARLRCEVDRCAAVARIEAPGLKNEVLGLKNEALALDGVLALAAAPRYAGRSSRVLVVRHGCPSADCRRVDVRPGADPSGRRGERLDCGRDLPDRGFDRDRHRCDSGRDAHRDSGAGRVALGTARSTQPHLCGQSRRRTASATISRMRPVARSPQQASREREPASARWAPSMRGGCWEPAARRPVVFCPDFRCSRLQQSADPRADN